MLTFKIFANDEPYGKIFFWISIFEDAFYIKWFTDCGDWFLYFGSKLLKHSIRFSSAGLIMR